MLQRLEIGLSLAIFILEPEGLVPALPKLRAILSRPFPETLQVFICRQAPSHFCHGEQPRIHEHLGKAFAVDTLRPHAGGNALDQGGLAGSHLFLHGFEDIHAVRRQIDAFRAPAYPRGVGKTLDVAALSRSHDHFVPPAHSLGARLGIPPGHDCGTLGHLAVEQVVPSDHLSATGTEICSDLADEPGLEGICICEPFLSHKCLALGTMLPVFLVSLISSDMYVFAREELYHFVQHLLEEIHGRRITQTEVIAFRPGAGKLRVSGGYLVAVAGHFDFGDYFDMALMRVGEQPADIVLGIIAAVSGRMPRNGNVDIAAVFPVVVPVGGTPCGKRGQARISVYLQTPAGTVGQVYVQAVHLHRRHHVHLLFQEFHAAEIARHVVHEPAISVSRIIHYRTALKRIRSGLHLLKAPEGVERPCLAGSENFYAFRSDFQHISLGSVGHKLADSLPERLCIYTYRRLGKRVTNPFSFKHFCRNRDDLPGNGYRLRGGRQAERNKQKQRESSFHLYKDSWNSEKIIIFAVQSGKMLEWLKRHVWKACDRPKRFLGSNPSLSASKTPCRAAMGLFFLRSNASQLAFCRQKNNPRDVLAHHRVF